MSGRFLLLAALGFAVSVVGCKKPEEGTTYVPPPNIQKPKTGTLYLKNACATGMDFYIGSKLLQYIGPGAYVKKEVPIGYYVIKAVEANPKPGVKPEERGRDVTVTEDKMFIISLP